MVFWSTILYLGTQWNFLIDTFGSLFHVTIAKARDKSGINKEIQCQTLLQMRYICADIWNIHVLEKDSSIVVLFFFSSQMTEWKTLEKLRVRQRQRCILCERKGKWRGKVEIVLLGVLIPFPLLLLHPFLALSLFLSLPSPDACKRQHKRKWTCSSLSLCFLQITADLTHIEVPLANDDWVIKNQEEKYEIF